MCIIGSAFAVSVVVTDIGVVFGITGATACTAVAYVLPAAFSGKLQGWNKYLIMTIVISTILGLLSMYQIIGDMI